MQISDYLDQLNQRLVLGHTSEHTFCGDLEALLKTLLPDFHVTNEPLQITDCGNPDYVITKDSVPIGYIEAKDIGKDLNSRLYKEQFTRYRNALDNLIITDYVWFQFYENGEKVAEIWLGKPSESTGQIIPLEKEFEKFTNLIQEFSTKVTQAIKSPVKLAEFMAGKARLLENILEEALLAWNFYIGGYQPAQKWLKDRQGRELSFDDILHYQKIIVALTQTDLLMQQTDKVLYPQGHTDE